jgi:peptidoglycan/xylan/chitin deacetylase (PgdA/CDA1 family)
MRLVDGFCGNSGPRFPSAVHNWKELESLAREGVTMAPHSRSHALLTRLRPEQVREEVRGSMQDLSQRIEEGPSAFCYPAGAHDDAVVRILREEGVVLAVTVLDGQNDLSLADPLRLRRTNITPRTSLPIFRLRLQRWASYLDAIRHGALPGRPAAWLGGSR